MKNTPRPSVAAGSIAAGVQPRDRNPGARSSRAARGADDPITATGTSAGAGISISSDRPGARILTLNIHKLVPASKKRTDAAETTAALRDTAAWIRKQDPDVVVLQEVDDDRARAGKGGVNEQLRRLSKLIDADGASMAAGMKTAEGDLYDNAIMTRNGFKLRQNHSADLPDKEYFMDRALGVADVRTPEGQDLTVLYTHTTTRGFSNNDLQAQLDAIGGAARTIRATGKLQYDDSVTGASRVARNLSRDNVVLAGDFNALAPRVSAAIGPDALRDAADDPQILADPARAQAAHAPSHKDRRIDHIFVAPGMQVDDTFVEDVTANEVKNDGVTDHRGVIADVLLAPSGAPSSGP